MIAGFVCAAIIVVLLLASDSHQGDRFLMPSFVGLLWAISLFTFIEAFSAVPSRVDADLTLFGRFGRRMKRGWYWVLMVVFLGATAVALVLTSRLVSIWLSEYSV